MDRFEIPVRKFAKQRRMSVKKVGTSGLRLKYGFNFLAIDVERVGDFILIWTYMPYPVRSTPKNLRLGNRLNCMLPDVKLVLDGCLRVCISRTLELSALKSDESLDDMLLKGARWGRDVPERACDVLQRTTFRQRCRRGVSKVMELK